MTQVCLKSICSKKFQDVLGFPVKFEDMTLGIVESQEMTADGLQIKFSVPDTVILNNLIQFDISHTVIYNDFILILNTEIEDFKPISMD